MECTVMAKMMMTKKATPHKGKMPDKAMMAEKAKEIAKRGVAKKEATTSKKGGKKLPPWLMYDANGKVVAKKGKK